ncbi:hypothetical protein CYJ73_18580 [Gordonia terrae]|uniref:Inosine/uridine-preferring nucleoside hydrolase domain-containing protein n=1 Tax=Gordonia terrae TaxID=2055 RepID=A0A2I1R4T0_9ACTN|nr:nucleoside hydrolase [Gordonia terrae]PKZ64133.1 hypothetical protein CYJ73_18580 [Gordonia terrae]
MSRPVILDVDTGNDDAVAIVIAALHPQIELLGCTTVAGNLPLEATTDNTLRVLDAIGRPDVAVHAGMGHPLAPGPQPAGTDSTLEDFHQTTLPVGRSGLKAASSNGVEWLIETLRQTSRPITLIPLAPLTNIATALTIAPDIRDAVAEVVLMGGGWKFGNRTAAAEFNIYADAVAANLVLRSGIRNLTVVPLDATHQVPVRRIDVGRYAAAGTPAGLVVSRLLDHYLRGYETSGSGDTGAPVHDALCVAYVIDPAVLGTEEVYVEVDTVSPSNYGRTTVDVRQPTDASANCRFAMHADVERFHRVLDEIVGSELRPPTPHNREDGIDRRPE